MTDTTRPIITLAELEATAPNAAGTERVYRCPICDGGTHHEKSLHVNTNTGAFNCKRASCGISGKLKEFWEDRPRMTRQQRGRAALAAAFRISHTNTPATPKTALRIDPTAKKEPATSDKDDWRPLYEQSLLIDGTAGATYLQGRGINATTATAAGCRYFTYHGRGRVIFPFMRDGELVAFQSRAIDDKPNPHYARGKKTDGVFATAPAALCADVVVLVEAPIDALSIATGGIDAVALGGTVAGDWLLRKLAFKKVLLAFDNDANGAGDNAATELAGRLRAYGATTRRLAPPRRRDAEKSDWNAVLMQDGTTIVKAFVTSGVRLMR